jgi:hypothetical protein
MKNTAAPHRGHVVGRQKSSANWEGALRTEPTAE